MDAMGSLTVTASALVFSPSIRNSMSVGIIQDRLAELGFPDARSDIRGWFHNGTARAVRDFQEYMRVPMTGEIDPETLTALLHGTGIQVT